MYEEYVECIYLCNTCKYSRYIKYETQNEIENEKQLFAMLLGLHTIDSICTQRLNAFIPGKELHCDK